MNRVEYIAKLIATRHCLQIHSPDQFNLDNKTTLYDQIMETRRNLEDIYLEIRDLLNDEHRCIKQGLVEQADGTLPSDLTECNIEEIWEKGHTYLTGNKENKKHAH